MYYMKYLKLFNESKRSKQDSILEILSKPGWKKIEPKNEYWLTQLDYQLTDNVKIMVLDLDNSSKELSYYLVKDGTYQYVSSYSNNYTLLFSEHDTIYRNMSNYDRMMKICNYLLPFFNRKPNDDLIEDIRYCFIEIEDKLGIEPELKWGYCDTKNEEFGFFPAFRFTDMLCLSIIYNHYGHKNYDDVAEEIEDGINRVIGLYDINRTYIKVIDDDSYRIIISIEF